MENHPKHNIEYSRKINEREHNKKSTIINFYGSKGITSCAENAIGCQSIKYVIMIYVKRTFVKMVLTWSSRRFSHFCIYRAEVKEMKFSGICAARNLWMIF
jgi:hypothetical protein